MVPSLSSKPETKLGFEPRKSRCDPNHWHIKHLSQMIIHNRCSRLQTLFDLALLKNCEGDLIEEGSGIIFPLRVEGIESEEARLSCVQYGSLIGTSALWLPS